MIYYFGTHIENFNVDENKRSRYGFACLFFTSDFDVAKLYAKHHAETNNKKKGFVFKVELKSFLEKIDYKGNVTHSSHFRNLIFDFSLLNNIVLVKEIDLLS